MIRSTASLLLFATVCLLPVELLAETGHEAWLRYPPINDPVVRQRYATLPSSVVLFGDSRVVGSAREELMRGVRGMLGRTLRIESKLPDASAIVLGTLADLPSSLAVKADLKPDAYWITTKNRHIVITAANDRGVLYGTFALLRKIGLYQALTPLDERQEPYAPIRWVNEWNNLDGTIERGYGGRSIFFDRNNVREDLGPVRDYARLLASLGINGCSISNVNANQRVITAEFLPQVARVAEIFRAWGVSTAVSVDFSSPRGLGGLDTFDPLDPRVVAFWKNKVDEIYKVIPDLGGFVLKADSEGRLGPSAYGRTHADAANVIARALKPHNGVIFYRGFVYNNRMDWRDLKNDRARAAHDNFLKLDGLFEDNVIIQIKHGPIDFQVREPASPLFGTLEKTSQAVELQITQEYFMQGRYMVYLVPMWKEALDFDLQARGAGTPVKALVAGKVFNRPGGFVGVSNVGLDTNWTGHLLSQANLYGYGRLAWNPNLTSAQIIDEWTRLTFSHDPLVVKTISSMQLASWRDFENHTGPLGTQTLTEMTGPHYGPAPEASERNGWGQWHRADAKGIGMDRTSATGTGFIGQYRPAVAKTYESLATCPDELILFLHHLPYTHVLRNGKTVIQHIYDAHYIGATAVQAYPRQWKTLEGRFDEPRYLHVLNRLEYQAGHVIVWRDAVNDWFAKLSGIKDAAGRVGNHPGRHEAESLNLTGYTIADMRPYFEGASGGKYVTCGNTSTGCSAALKFGGKPGQYDINVRYFDQNDGVSHFRLLVNDQVVEEWAADDIVPSRKPDSHSSARRLVSGVALRTADTVRVEGVGQGNERAALDYIEITAQ